MTPIGYVYINGQGYIIDISNEKAEVPIIIGYSTEATNFILGNRLNNDDLKRLEVANRIIETANSNEILSLITKIDISNEENYAIILQSEGKFNKNLQNVKNQLQYLQSAVKKLQKDLPKNIFNECKPQLEQFERIINADFTALELLKNKRSNDTKQIKQLETSLKIQLEEIKSHEKNVAVSEKTCRAFIDEVLNE